MNETPLEQKLATVERQLVVLQLRVMAQSMALHALARTHSDRPAALQLMREYGSELLAMQDSSPLSQEAVNAALAEINAAIEALTRGPGS